MGIKPVREVKLFTCSALHIRKFGGQLVERNGE